jgi:hypothetical protein
VTRSAASRRRLAAVLVAGVVGALVAPAVVAVDAQDAPVTYDAVASADGLRLEVRTPGLFLSNLFDGGLPVAQAESNSLGRSQSFAAMPYPGESVAAVGSLLLPLLGLPALPPYPLQASAAYPSNPEYTASAGAYVMDADGRADGAKGSVTAGVSAGGDQAGYLEVSATTSADPDTGEVVARGRTLVQGASVAGLISIGKVEALAEVRGGPTGTPKRTSSFEVEGLSVAGVRLAVTAKGVELLSLGSVPLPDVGLQQVLDAAGIHLEYLQAKEVEGGVISAGLSITFPAPFPPPYNMTLTVTLGRARAMADISTNGATGDAGADLTDGGTVGFETSGLTPPLGSDTGRVSSPPAAPRTRTVSSVGPLTASATSFYAVLVAAAIVALLSVALIRRSGGKPKWTS